jgi:hypothetical protein
MEFLQTFRPGLDIIYKPGKVNPADALSRRPDHLVDKPTSSEVGDHIHIDLQAILEPRQPPRQPEVKSAPTSAPTSKFAPTDTSQRANLSGARLVRIKPRQPLPEVKNECPTLIQGEMAIPEGEKSVVDLAPLSSWLASEADFLNDVKQAYNNDNHFDASTRPQVYERHDGLWCIPAYFGPHGETPISAQDTRRVQLVPQVNGEPQWN